MCFLEYTTVLPNTLMLSFRKRRTQYRHIYSSLPVDVGTTRVSLRLNAHPPHTYLFSSATATYLHPSQDNTSLCGQKKVRMREHWQVANIYVIELVHHHATCVRKEAGK